MRSNDIRLGRGWLLILSSAVMLAGCASGPFVRPGSDERFLPTLPHAALPAQAPPDGAIYDAATSLTLFEDDKARRVGDVLTVVLSERTDARKSANASSSKDSSLDLEAPTLLGDPVTHDGIPLFNAAEATRSFEGAGDAAQSNQLQGDITVTVAEVLPNGNLIVQGEKWIAINQGQEYVRLRGIVRPVDIRVDNTVISTKIANAQVAYGGTGSLARSSAPGWLTRFFNSPVWPF